MGFKYVKKMTCFTQYSGNTGLRLDPQYTLVVKLVNQGVEIQKKKGFGGVWGGEEGGDTCLALRNIPSVRWVYRELIDPTLFNSFRKKKKKLNPTSVIRAERFINPPDRSHFHNSTRQTVEDRLDRGSAARQSSQCSLCDWSEEPFRNDVYWLKKGAD